MEWTAQDRGSAQGQKSWGQSVGLDKENRSSKQFSLCTPNLIWGVDECADKESGAAFKSEDCDQLAMSAAVVG